MTLDQYRDQLVHRVISAPDQRHVIAAVKDAHRTLSANQWITNEEHESFWREVRQELRLAASRVYEKQAVSALSQLIDAAEEAIRELERDLDSNN